GAPTGTVSFYDGGSTTGTLLGTNTLNSADQTTVATASLSVGSGTTAHAITAVYNDDGNFTGSTSSVLTQVVNKDGTTTVVSSDHNASVFAQNVTFTPTLPDALPSSGAPTGTVSFYDGGSTTGTLLGT